MEEEISCTGTGGSCWCLSLSVESNFSLYREVLEMHRWRWEGIVGISQYRNFLCLELHIMAVGLIELPTSLALGNSREGWQERCRDAIDRQRRMTIHLRLHDFKTSYFWLVTLL